ncbi:MAG: YiiX/YebB-like N1pC/P60 family cysteine hydrolase, partial [Hyphomicrobiaceae bacterium]
MSDKQPMGDLAADLASSTAWALAPSSDAYALSQNLAKVYGALRALDLGRYDARQVAHDAPLLMHQLFLTRMALRDRTDEWHARGIMTADVQTAIRNLLRITRYGGDMLGEMAIGFRKLPPTEARTMTAFTGEQSNTLVNPRFVTGSDLAFQSGDVLLVRGRAHNSAAIARIGDVDSQYSHVGMVYIDKSGRHWFVEVLIEKGGIIVPLQDALDHGLGRAILFRHRDAVLAANAGYIAYDLVRRSLSSSGRPIRYDFTMRLDGKVKQMFCSKLVRYAFEKASEGEVRPSTFQTRLDMKNADFFDRIGVLAHETFAPGDMELEPGFDVVAEWQ